VGGWSFGGYVAYEMAQQFRQMNEDVGALFLLDITAVAPKGAQKEEGNERFLKLEDAEYLLRIVQGESTREFSLEAVQHKGPEERLQYLVSQLIDAKILPSEVTVQQVRDFILGWKRRAQSVNDYDMRKFDGTITLIRATEPSSATQRPDLDPNDLTAGFSKFSTSPVKVYFVQGAKHANLVTPPFSERVRDIMEECIEEAESHPAYKAKGGRLAEVTAMNMQA